MPSFSTPAASAPYSATATGHCSVAVQRTPRAGTDPLEPPPRVWVRVAEFPADRAAIEALHAAFLEVRYDAPFYDGLERDPTCVTLVAQAGAELVGVVTARTWSDEAGGGAASWAERQIDFWLRGARRPGYVMTLGVLSAHRRRGVGAALLRAVGSLLVSGYGATELQLHCLATNAHARALYAAHGFVVCAELPGYYEIGGARLPGVRMRCVLRRGGAGGRGGAGEAWWTVAAAVAAPVTPTRGLAAKARGEDGLAEEEEEKVLGQPTEGALCALAARADAETQEAPAADHGSPGTHGPSSTAPAPELPSRIAVADEQPPADASGDNGVPWLVRLLGVTWLADGVAALLTAVLGVDRPLPPPLLPR